MTTETTDFDKLLPPGILFPLAQIDDIGVIKKDMSKKLIVKGELEVVRIGTKLHISRTELIRYLEENTSARSE